MRNPDTISDVMSIPDLESLDKIFQIMGNTLFLGEINTQYKSYQISFIGVAVAHCHGNWLAIVGSWVRILALAANFRPKVAVKMYKNITKWFPARK